MSIGKDLTQFLASAPHCLCLEDAGEATARPCLEYRSEKNLSPKKVKKSLNKKGVSEKGTRESITNYAFFLH